MPDTKQIELRGTMPGDRIQQTLRAARGQWVGCDWNTQFGQRRLNLRGLAARQARLLANATAGEESRAWRDAEIWLRRVETDAHTAEAAAVEAVAYALNGDWAAAEREATRTYEIEMSYDRLSVWRDLLAVIREIHANSFDSLTPGSLTRQ